MCLPRFLFLFILAAFISNGFAQEFIDNTENNLVSQWDIEDSESEDRGLFVIKKYKPVYLLPLKFSGDMNRFPQSPGPDHTLEEPIDLNRAETKFQLSFKIKILNDVLGKKAGGDIWLGYTQTSFWQLYNSNISRPFRETNYEPELMFVLPVPYKVVGMESVFMGLGITHQSNGRSNPLSRSWNRVVAQFAWEGRHSSLIFKPWYRFSESSDEDDNPDIEDYMGRGELLYAYGKGRHHISCRGRHSLRFGENNRGSIQFDYAFRIWDNLKLHGQLFSGYGESMIDYNYKQTCFGIGISLTEWR